MRVSHPSKSFQACPQEEVTYIPGVVAGLQPQKCSMSQVSFLRREWNCICFFRPGFVTVDPTPGFGLEK